MKEFKLKEDYIELIRLLKYVRIADTGGHAKILVDEGLVKLNGEVEHRKRAKVRAGDIVEAEGQTIAVVSGL
ncbi:MAG: RNA-binding S4 domain-containing protein [Bacteroidota bacterium]